MQHKWAAAKVAKRRAELARRARATWSGMGGVDATSPAGRDKGLWPEVSRAVYL